MVDHTASAADDQQDRQTLDFPERLLVTILAPQGLCVWLWWLPMQELEGSYREAWLAGVVFGQTWSG